MELSPLQKLLLMWQHDGNDHIVCPVVLGGAAFSESQLRAAVSRLQEKHPVLRSVVALDSDGSFRLRESDSASVPNTFEVWGEDWQSVASRYTNSVQFPKPSVERPTATWRVALAQGKTAGDSGDSETALVFVLNHVCFDGMAWTRLLRQFLQQLQRASGGEEERDGTGEDEAPYAAPMIDTEALMPKLRISWPRFVLCALRMVWVEVWHAWTDWRYPLEEAPGVKDPGLSGTTEQLFLSLTEAETSALSARCRAERTTVHAALSAAAHNALGSLQASDRVPSGSFYIGHLVSHWRDLDRWISPDAVAGVLIGFHLEKAFWRAGCHLWDLARRVKAGLGWYHPLQPGHLALYRRLMAACVDLSCCLWPERRRRNATYASFQRGLHQLSISNLGRVELGQVGAAAVRKAFFWTPRHRSLGGVGGLHVLTLNGRLHLVVSYYSHLWPLATARAFLVNFSATLRAMTTE